MKTSRFLIQDVATLQAVSRFETYIYFNPITKKDRDLIFSGLTNLITIPSLRWRGDFFSFRSEFEKQLNHEFFHPHKDPLSKVSADALEKITIKLEQGIKAQKQLALNLAPCYQAGFDLIPKGHFEFWVDATHLHFDNSKNAHNMIFKRNLFFAEECEMLRPYYLPRGEHIHDYQQNILHSMNETDLKSVCEVRVVYTPEYKLKVTRP